MVDSNEECTRHVATQNSKSTTLLLYLCENVIVTSNERLLVLFGINGKKRLILILKYQNHKNRRLYSENIGRGGTRSYPPSVDVLQKNVLRDCKKSV